MEFSHGGGRKGDPAAQFEATWIFEALDAQTRVTIYMLFPTPADRDRVVNVYGAIEGGKQTLARLANYLTKT
ncbi:MAG: SRPBCC family protein [Gallionella sp.]